jgi:methyl-accepting chemotaxis protein
MNEINKCAQMSEDAEGALNEIMAASLENESKVENIIAGVEEELQRNSRDVGDSLKALDRINHENGRSIEGITASVQEMNRQVGEMIKMAKFLSDIAQSQDSLIKQFILEEAVEK